MKTTTVNLTYDDSYKCPYCGELYRQLSAPKPGETLTTVCDGEDGCGERFQVKFVQQ